MSQVSILYASIIIRHGPGSSLNSLSAEIAGRILPRSVMVLNDVNDCMLLSLTSAFGGRDTMSTRRLWALSIEIVVQPSSRILWCWKICLDLLD